MNTTLKIQSQFIAESMKNGDSFEKALDKSFNQVNEFLNSLNDSEMFKTLAFEATKNIVNKL